MKKIIKFIVPLLVTSFLFSATSCNEKRIPPVTCNISLLKENDLNSEKFESSELKVGTEFFILINFKLCNTSDAEDTITFTVDVPGAEYYKAFDWERGPIVPKITPMTKLDPVTGESVEVFRAQKMQFSIPANKTYYSFNYLFSVKAKQACNNMQIIASFNDYEDMIKDGDTKTFTLDYSFID